MKNQKAIIVAHPVTGAVITLGESEKGNKYGKMRVDQKSLSSEGGALRVANRSAFITIFEDDLEFALANFKAGDEYPIDGKIVRKETREPQYDGHKAKINPETKEDFLVGGQKVYMTDTWTGDLNALDQLITEASSVEAAAEVVSEEEEA
jgi:hypothetical protein